MSNINIEELIKEKHVILNEFKGKVIEKVCRFKGKEKINIGLY
jgi:hypothetical protein